ncbi:hypothetical protein [Chromohalobacter canadensis]|uniref:hypothetical protein n=1 Tax=Chromohalobacter canadensis TaxID=141389 RepID=UPI00241017C3|nr:hypothetical protein [Chromohalobacter canadensis]
MQRIRHPRIVSINRMVRRKIASVIEGGINRLTAIQTPRGSKRSRCATGLRTCRQIAERYN